MYRVDNASAITVLPTPQPVGPKPNAFYGQGTIVEPDHLNMITEEIATLIEKAGITLKKSKRNQLNQAIFHAVHGWTRQQYFAQAPLLDGPLIEWDLTKAQTATLTIGGNRTLAPPLNPKAGATYLLHVVQDDVGGHTLSFGEGYLWENGIVPSLTINANSVDLFSFYSDGTNLLGTVAKAYA